jgi:hypothetical protein
VILATYHPGQAAKVCLSFAFVIAVFLAICVEVDASLRAKTVYKITASDLIVYRDGEERRTIPRRQLVDIKPEWVDSRGIGTAALPETGRISDLLHVDNMENFIPSLRPDRSMLLIRDVEQVCNMIRSWARE